MPALSVVGDPEVVVTPGGMVGVKWWTALHVGSEVSCGQSVGLMRVEVCLASKGGAKVSKGYSVVSRRV